MYSNSLFTSTAYVQTPFITVKIGDYTFGKYSDTSKKGKASFTKQFPNNLQSMTVTKINGQVNTYAITLVHVITPGTDPNLIDKALSSIADTRKIFISYGDLSTPLYTYKDEAALLVKVTSRLNFSSSSIIYTLTAQSSSTLLNVGSFPFPKRTKTKPSDVIIDTLLTDRTYGLLDMFPGMADLDKVRRELIACDDQEVTLEAKSSISPLDYLRYLVSCMTQQGTVKNSLIKSKYVFSIYDDINNKYGGQYFKITRVEKSAQEVNSISPYTIDVGFPHNNYVTDFSFNNNEAYSMYYKYAGTLKQSEYTYRIADDGSGEYKYYPQIASNDVLYKLTDADKDWWTQMTQYATSATITLQGLLRPAMLMSYLYINTYFYGNKHTSSGLYIITKEVDTISSSGFSTQLSLTRVKGDSL